MDSNVGGFVWFVCVFVVVVDEKVGCYSSRVWGLLGGYEEDAVVGTGGLRGFFESSVFCVPSPSCGGWWVFLWFI